MGSIADWVELTRYGHPNTTGGAVVGTAAEAGLGAAIGSASGTNEDRVYGWHAQRWYNIAYLRRM
ncbi:MAG: hypothetical protein ABSA46_19980 [Thermodesulfovibrionales bacterium]|jgi:hypothetical protein